MIRSLNVTNRVVTRGLMEKGIGSFVGFVRFLSEFLIRQAIENCLSQLRTDGRPVFFYLRNLPRINRRGIYSLSVNHPS